jgi:hypothetical protein
MKTANTEATPLGSRHLLPPIWWPKTVSGHLYRICYTGWSRAESRASRARRRVVRGSPDPAPPLCAGGHTAACSACCRVATPHSARPQVSALTLRSAGSLFRRGRIANGEQLALNMLKAPKIRGEYWAPSTNSDESACRTPQSTADHHLAREAREAQRKMFDTVPQFL